MKRLAFFACFGAWVVHGAAFALTISPEDDAARQVAIQWLQLVDSGDYGHAVGQSPEQIGIQQNWISYLLARRKPLGKVARRVTVEVKSKPKVLGAQTWWKYKAVRFKTSFEHDPVAMEEVILTKMACCWEVSGYTIFLPGRWNETREHAGQFSESGK